MKTVTRYVRNIKVVTNHVHCTGRFPFRTSFRKIKVTKNGVKTSGTKIQSTKILSETLKISKVDGYLTAFNIMKTTEGGFPCQYLYSGEVSVVHN